MIINKKRSAKKIVIVSPTHLSCWFTKRGRIIFIVIILTICLTTIKFMKFQEQQWYEYIVSTFLIAKRVFGYHYHLCFLLTTNYKEDLIYSANRKSITYYIGEINPSESIMVPKSWCKQKDFKPVIKYKQYQNHLHRLNNKTQQYLLSHCFPQKIPSDSVRQKIRKSLRILRYIFDKNNIPLYLTFGSVLGSLRYHNRMFYATDYDFAIFTGDFDGAWKSLEEISADSKNEMRFIDARKTQGILKLGLVCGEDQSWKFPEYWGERKVTINGSVPVFNNPHDVHTFMSQCESNVDFYEMLQEDSNEFSITGTKARLVVDDIFNFKYRPLEGTLFRTMKRNRSFMKNVYAADMTYCIPNKKCNLKEHRHVQNTLQRLFGVSEEINSEKLFFPCEMLDVVQPRIYNFMYKKTRFELGLRWVKPDKCQITSIFMRNPT